MCDFEWPHHQVNGKAADERPLNHQSSPDADLHANLLRILYSVCLSAYFLFASTFETRRNAFHSNVCSSIPWWLDLVPSKAPLLH
jgi:hypothetical protein